MPAVHVAAGVRFVILSSGRSVRAEDGVVAVPSSDPRVAEYVAAGKLIVDNPATEPAPGLWAPLPSVERTDQPSRLGASMGALGDSITLQNRGTGAVLLAPGFGTWASILSGGKLRLSTSRATAGFTAKQVHDTHLAGIIADKPSCCTVMVGTNDGDPAKVTDLTVETFPYMAAMYDKLLAAGITPIICTPPPQDPVGDEQRRRVDWIADFARRAAEKRGVPFVDMRALATNTGAWPSGAKLDASHPNPLGARLMGQAIVDAFAGRLPAFGPSLAYAQQGPTGTTNLVSSFDPLFLGQGASPTTPQNWSVTGSGATSSLDSTDATIRGNWFVLSQPAGVETRAVSNNFTVVPGNRVQLAARIRATVPAGNTFEIAMLSASGTTYVCGLNGVTCDVPAGSVIVAEGDVPAGLTSARVWARMTGSGSGGTFRVAQVKVTDLTALGLT